jgi:hypothetical protein
MQAATISRWPAPPPAAVPGQLGSHDGVVGAWLLSVAKAVTRPPAELTIAVVA